MNQDRFSSLVELQQAHDDLSRTQASTGRASPDPARVAEFVRRAVATGAVLDSREERSVAQSLTNFWGKAPLNANTRAAAPTDGTRFSPTNDTSLAVEVPPSGSSAKAAAKTVARPSPTTSDTALSDSALAGDSALATEKSTNGAAGNELVEDTLLAEYNSDTLGESAAAADRVIESLSDEDADLARRLVLRLVRLRPEGKKFDAIPTSRAAMQTYGDPAAVDRIIDRLAATGVVRVTPGESPAADRIGLRSVDLRAVWPRLNEWMDARVAFRDRASAPPPDRGIWRFPDMVMTWLTKQLASVSRFFVRLRQRVAPTPSTEVSERELDDAELYHDHNARESEYLRRVRDRRRRINEANRVLVLLATILFAAAVVGWGLARSKASLATENEQAANDRLRLSNLRQVCRAWAQVITARSDEQRQIAEQRWNSLTSDRIVRKTFARDDMLPTLRSFAAKAYIQQSSLQSLPPASSTDLHRRLMHEIESLRDELVRSPTVRPSLDMTRKLAFESVCLCIDKTYEYLADPKLSYGEAGPYIREFWDQYWGEMILVEGELVEKAMVNYGNVLNKLRDATVNSAVATPPTDRAKTPPPTEPPTSTGSEAKAEPHPARPATAKDGAPPPPPASARPPGPSPKPEPPAAAPSPEELDLLKKLQSLSLDQAERLIRRTREAGRSKELLDELLDARNRLRDALEKEGKRDLEDVLKD